MKEIEALYAEYNSNCDDNCHLMTEAFRILEKIKNAGGMGRIVYDAGFANIVAEAHKVEGVPTAEILICLEDKETGTITQDIALVRQGLVHEKAPAIIPGTIECLVWAHSDEENFTNQFHINHYVEESEANHVHG